jgi:NADH:ubiquinone oxidoreductase subunit 5 (subunit L)/multisubunit Na+/H+ antiporter MnhA subunit
MPGTGPAWMMAFVGPFVLVGFFLAPPDWNRMARIAAALIGLGGLLFLVGVPCLISTVYSDRPFVFNVEMAMGIYVLLSYVLFAAFWKAHRKV